MSKNKFNSLFPDQELGPTNLKLLTYCGKELQILGYATVKVENKIFELNIYVIQEVHFR